MVNARVGKSGKCDTGEMCDGMGHSAWEGKCDCMAAGLHGSGATCIQACLESEEPRLGCKRAVTDAPLLVTAKH
jgi:hypothetical protein